MTRGDVRVRGVNPKHLSLVLDKLRAAGAEVTPEVDGFRVVQHDRPRAINFATLPYPGFPTDLQPMAIGLAAVADGTSMITENVFEARFRFVEEMIRLGADARTDGHHAVVRGVEELSSAPVWSSDIRAGAGLVLAGLCADGVTEVHDVYHIDRGYPRFVEIIEELGGRHRTGELRILISMPRKWLCAKAFHASQRASSASGVECAAHHWERATRRGCRRRSATWGNGTAYELDQRIWCPVIRPVTYCRSERHGHRPGPQGLGTTRLDAGA